jgi:hypothetical protein
LQKKLSDRPSPPLALPPEREGKGWGKDFTLGEILQLSRKNLFRLMGFACFEYSDQFLCNSKDKFNYAPLVKIVLDLFAKK